MIVVDAGESLRIITQPDHARFAGELLSLWRRDGLPEHPRRQQLLEAVREHDNGWQEADSAPRVDAKRQRPLDFIHYPAADHIDCWNRGIRRFAATRPYVTLLIAAHAEALNHSLGGDPFSERLAALEPLLHDCRERAGVDAPVIQEDYRWLQLADRISLGFCNRRPLETRALGYTARADDNGICLDPFPLAGATTFRVPVRYIPKRPYPRDSDLGSALARARWLDLQVRVAPFQA